MSDLILSSPFPLFVSKFQPSAVQRKAVLGRSPGDVRHTCPIHLHRLLLICVAGDVTSVLRSSSSLVMVLGQHTPKIFRRHLFWKVSSLSASLAVGFQHSEPQRSTPRMLLLYSLSFIFNLSCLDFQMDFSIVKVWLAFLIVAMASFAESRSVVILLPQILNIETCIRVINLFIFYQDRVSKV